MGADALQGNGVTAKILYLIRDHHLTPLDEPLRRVRKSRIVMFTLIQLIGFGATFAIVQTIGTPCWVPSVKRVLNKRRRLASIGFPIIILLLVPVRTSLIPLLPFTAEELSILDRATASPFVSFVFNAIHSRFHYKLSFRRWSLLEALYDIRETVMIKVHVEK